MSLRTVKAPTTDVSVVVRIVDSTDGTPEQGVVAATAGLAFWYRREGGPLQALAGLNDLATLDAAHNDSGLLHIDDGYYRLDVPDAAFIAGADGVLIGGAATGMVVIGSYVQLVGYDARLELTAAVLANLDTPVSSRGTADPGDQMGLADDAITASKFDESTAFPVKAADAGSTYIARTGAASDTLETLSDQMDGLATLGAGAVEWSYTLTSSVDGTAIGQADVWVTTDSAGTNVVASGTTSDLGVVTFYLDAGSTYYIWRSKSGWTFTNPDSETVS